MRIQYIILCICNIIAIYVIILVRPSVAIRTMAVIMMPNILVRAERFYSRVNIYIYIIDAARKLYRLGRFNRSQRCMRPYACSVALRVMSCITLMYDILYLYYYYCIYLFVCVCVCVYYIYIVYTYHNLPSTIISIICNYI